MVENKRRVKIKGLADDHPAQKDFGEFMEKRLGEINERLKK